MSSSSSTETYSCEPCGMSFNSQQDLDHHNRQEHQKR